MINSKILKEFKNYLKKIVYNYLKNKILIKNNKTITNFLNLKTLNLKFPSSNKIQIKNKIQITNKIQLNNRNNL